MKIISLETNQLNQNQYNLNLFTPEFIGSLVIYPIDYTHHNCLPCDGYVLKISDYQLLYSIISTKFNTGEEATDEFRIPDYNISGRFLQPNKSPGKIFAAGIPNIVGVIGAIGLSGAKYSGAFYKHSTGGSLANNGEPDYNAGFNASKCSSIYGASSTVQPPSQGVHICIRYK